MPTPVPNEYKFLTRETGPRILLEALKLFGVVEAPGPANNEAIINWAKEIGDGKLYSADEIPWCGLFAGVCAFRAGLELPSNPLWALNWAAWGTAIAAPELGCICVFTRQTVHGKAGHVGLYVGEDAACFHILGGNQSDQVCIRRIPKERLFAARETTWKIAKPSNVRRVYFNGDGVLSKSEA